MKICKNCKEKFERLVGHGYCRKCYNKLRAEGKLLLNPEKCLVCREIKDIYAKGMCRRCYDKKLSEKRKKGKPIKKCVKCGKEFQAKSKVQKFCSPQCKAEPYTKECDWCGKGFKTNRKNQKICSPECRKEANWDRFQKNMEAYSQKVSELYDNEDYNEAHDWYVWAKESRWGKQPNTSNTYEELYSKMRKRVKNGEEYVGDTIEEEIFDNFRSAIKVFKKLLIKFKGNDKISKLILRDIASAYFHMGDFENSVKYFDKANQYGNLSFQYENWENFARKLNKLEKEYYSNKGYSEEEIKKITPKVITPKQDVILEIGSKFFNKKESIVKSFINERYDKIKWFNPPKNFINPVGNKIEFSGGPQNLEEFEEFQGLPFLQIFNESGENKLNISIGSNLTPSIEYSFFIVSNKKEEIYRIILEMNVFIKILKKIFDVEYSPYVNKPSESVFLDDYGDLLNCKNIDEIKQIEKKAKKERYKLIKEERGYYYNDGIINITPKGYKVELEDKIYIKGPNKKVGIIDLSKLSEMENE